VLAKVACPRGFRVIALPAPAEREKTRCTCSDTPDLLAAGEIVIFDRSWYNRAGVERVMGSCTEEQAKHLLLLAPMVEKTTIESGIIMLKYCLEVCEDSRHAGSKRASTTAGLEQFLQDGRIKLDINSIQRAVKRGRFGCGPSE